MFSFKIDKLILFLLKSLLAFLKILLHCCSILFKSFKQSFNLLFVLTFYFKYIFFKFSQFLLCFELFLLTFFSLLCQSLKSLCLRDQLITRLKRTDFFNQILNLLLQKFILLIRINIHRNLLLLNLSSTQMTLTFMWIGLSIKFLILKSNKWNLTDFSRLLLFQFWESDVELRLTISILYS